MREFDPTLLSQTFSSNLSTAAIEESYNCVIYKRVGARSFCKNILPIVFPCLFIFSTEILPWVWKIPGVKFPSDIFYIQHQIG